MATYEAQVGLRNDRTGAVFAPGDIVTDDDFPAETISYWLERGHLEPLTFEAVDEEE